METPADYVYGICQRTGIRVKAEDIVQEWTGLMVRRQSLDPKHPLLDIPAPRGEELRANPSGQESIIDIGDTSDPPTIEELGANS